MTGLINVADVVNDPFCAQSFQIRRYSGSFSNEGEYSRGTPVIINRWGSIQPANQDDLAILPEGERDGKFIKCYCTSDIRKGDGSLDSDEILWDSKNYRVKTVKLYKDYGYWFAIAEESI